MPWVGDASMNTSRESEAPKVPQLSSGIMVLVLIMLLIAIPVIYFFQPGGRLARIEAARQAGENAALDKVAQDDASAKQEFVNAYMTKLTALKQDCDARYELTRQALRAYDRPGGEQAAVDHTAIEKAAGAR